MKPALVSPGIIECHSYTDHIPDYAEHELARLHAGRYSSLPHFEIYGLAEQASTYVARHGERPTTLLLYRRDGPVVRVLNEGIPLTMDEARRFADHVFQRPHPAGAVLFRAVQMARAPASALTQHIDCEQDSVLMLPGDQARYWNSLGGCTRALLKNRLNKIRREHPDFAFKVAERGNIDPQHVRAILALHRERSQGWRNAVHLDACEELRVIQMVARCGLAGIATIGGRCCGGSICYRNGDVVSARFLAHDPAYDIYRLGFLCAYLMCAHCADHDDIRQFNFGWGKEAYKARLGGQPRTLSDVVIYRNRTQRLRLAPLALRVRMRGWQFQLRRLRHALRP